MSPLSLVFLIFISSVFIGYWTLRNASLRVQNSFLLIASYFFYAWGDWRFLTLLIANSIITYLLARAIANQAIPGRKKLLLLLGVVFTVGILAFFKYYNFFADSFVRALSLLGISSNIHTLKLILPLGISYFTFKSLSFMIEVYRGKLSVTRDVVAYFTYIGFFPQLIAGPIDRPSTLLTQIETRRQMDLPAIYLGAKQGLWGLFKKLVVANALVKIVDPIFADYTSRSGFELMIGAIFYSIEIYCDFSGYTDIANGCARILGFHPIENFTRPYFSRDIGEFWRRWHISLTSWFRDYIFYPLGGGLISRWKVIRNTLITFTVSGLWHGANWTFVVWGFAHGMLMVPIILGIQKTHTKKVAHNRMFPKWNDLWQMALTLSLVTALWVVFRADSITQAVEYLTRCFTAFDLHLLTSKRDILRSLVVVGAMFILEWQKREAHTPLDLKFRSRSVRWLFYTLVLITILLLGNFNESAFLYGQF